jgi:hypothetical protein
MPLPLAVGARGGCPTPSGHCPASHRGGPGLPPMVLRVMHLCGSHGPIRLIYGATPDPNGGLLAAALAFFSHQGHLVVHDPCLDLKLYHCNLVGAIAMVIRVDCSPPVSS